MARVSAPLTDLRCRQARYSPTGPKKLFDGGGLYLELTASGKKKWRMKYRQHNRKENVLIFGNYPTVSLADAREAREVARALLAEGKDPAVEREIRRQRIAQTHSETFKAIAQEAMELKKTGWSASHHKRVPACAARM